MQRGCSEDMFPSDVSRPCMHKRSLSFVISCMKAPLVLATYRLTSLPTVIMQTLILASTTTSSSEVPQYSKTSLLARNLTLPSARPDLQGSARAIFNHIRSSRGTKIQGPKALISMTMKRQQRPIITISNASSIRQHLARLLAPETNHCTSTQSVSGTPRSVSIVTASLSTS